MFFLKWANPGLLTCLFLFFSHYNFYNTNWKSIDGVLGIWTWGRRWKAQTQPQSYGGHPSCRCLPGASLLLINYPGLNRTPSLCLYGRSRLTEALEQKKIWIKFLFHFCCQGTTIFHDQQFVLADFHSCFFVPSDLHSSCSIIFIPTYLQPS